MNAYAKSADSYLAQRILGAGPEQQAALLMEAGQRYLGKAIKAMEQKDHFEASNCLRRVTDIITESVLRLNADDGGELVENLFKLYDWWTREILEAGANKDTARLGNVSSSMGEIRQAWEQLHEKQVRATQEAGFQVGDRVI
ncbi:MAG TPA: flagellar export chaperone FliS [Geothrix sp.]|nr:flagellar export chaperone FliS [Geothrix sp.]